MRGVTHRSLSEGETGCVTVVCNSMPVINYKSSLTQKAKELRKHSTLGEIILWKYLKNKQILGYDFHRQKPLYNYIVDFFCPKLLLALEIDGMATHIDRLEYDKKRQTFLESKNIKFLRFTELEVRTNIEQVLYIIENFIHQQRSHTPAYRPPLSRGE